MRAKQRQEILNADRPTKRTSTNCESLELDISDQSEVFKENAESSPPTLGNIHIGRREQEKQKLKWQAATSRYFLFAYP
jgi:hypothetical protein